MKHYNPNYIHKCKLKFYCMLICDDENMFWSQQSVSQIFV